MEQTHTGLVIIRFAFAEDLDGFWNSPDAVALADADDGLVALACAGLPYEGWPGNFVPTIATVDVPASETPRTFMVIEGTGTDQGRMDTYRDQILPMMRQRGAYYVALNWAAMYGCWRDDGAKAFSLSHAGRPKPMPRTSGIRKSINSNAFRFAPG